MFIRFGFGYAIVSFNTGDLAVLLLPAIGGEINTSVTVGYFTSASVP